MFSLTKRSLSQAMVFKSISLMLRWKHLISKWGGWFDYIQLLTFWFRLNVVCLLGFPKSRHVGLPLITGKPQAASPRQVHLTHWRDCGLLTHSIPVPKSNNPFASRGRLLRQPEFQTSLNHARGRGTSVCIKDWKLIKANLWPELVGIPHSWEVIAIPQSGSRWVAETEFNVINKENISTCHFFVQQHSF